MPQDVGHAFCRCANNNIIIIVTGSNNKWSNNLKVFLKLLYTPIRCVFFLPTSSEERDDPF